jgi:gliding motility-associated-like protein
VIKISRHRLLKTLPVQGDSKGAYGQKIVHYQLLGNRIPEALRHFFITILTFLITAASVKAACPGGPTINGSRTPSIVRCVTLTGSIPPGTTQTFTISALLSNYTIVWGDGKANNTGVMLAAGSLPSHTYDSLGVYNFMVIGTTAGACQDTIFGTFHNLRPVSSTIKPLPSGQNVGCAPHTITFEDLTENAFPGTVLTWNFGDGTGNFTRTSTQANTPFPHTYLPASVPACTTQVSLTAENANCTIGPVTVTVGPILILDRDDAVIGPPTPGPCNPSRTYTFPNNTVVNCPPLHAFRLVYWDFGDGTNDGAFNTNYGSRTHTFPDTGTYTITLIDSNDCGADVTTTQITINFPPLAGFTATPVVGCMPLTVSFNDTSRGNGITRAWNFGDGFAPTTGPNDNTLGSPAIKSPSHRYDSAGVYTVRLTVANACSTGVFVQKTITVYGKPRALIRGIRNGCAPHTVTLQDSTRNTSANATYVWTFGNGQTSTAKNPTAVTYTVAGTYNVKLVVTDTCGVDSITRTIRVDSVPTAVFTSNTVCKFDSTTFNGTGSIVNAGDVLTYKWYLSTSPIDSSKTGTTAKFRYNGAGFTYRAILKVTSDKGCVDYDTANAVVKISPQLTILTSPANVCDTTPVVFTGDTVGSLTPIVDYQWTFGAGTSDTASSKDTSYRFPGPGTYTVLYSANNSIGCSTTVSRNVTIHPLPDARPTAAIACFGQGTQFRDSSTVGSGNTITQWQWDFDNNGSTDNSTQHPVSTLPSATTFKIKLRVGTNNNCFNTDSVNVTVNPIPGISISNMGTSKCKLDTFIFTNATTGANSYRWRFGDGSADSVTNSLANLNKIYTDSGTFVVKMIATTALGCKDSSSFTVNSRPFPVAWFTVNDSISCAPKNFVFTNTSILANNYTWRVNGTPTTTNVNRADTNIATSGQSFVVSLIATNVFGCRQDTTAITMQTINNPVPNFTMSVDSGCGPLDVQFTNASTGATAYQWQLGNGNVVGATNPLTTYLPSALNDSIYTIKLIAFNGPGCRDSLSKTVRVFPQPIAGYTQDQTANCGPLPVTFTNTSVHKFGGTISDMTFRWRFGNGDSSQTQDPAETFVASLLQDTTYNVRLIASSRFGCSDTAQSTVKVFPNATANFLVANPNGCGTHSTNFINLSVPNDTGNISMMTFQWNFANGNTSTTVNPSQAFIANLTQDTIYDVRLIAFSEHGCRDTSFKPVRVFPKPLSDFTISDPAGCTPLNTTFTNTSLPYDTGSIVDMTFVWDFGNGFNSINQDASSQYISKPLADSTYTIKLYALSEHGCRDTSQQTVTVHPLPSVTFTSNIIQGCGPLSVNFTSNPVLATNWHWDFGDGDTAATTAPTHVFQSYPLADSIYDVTLSVGSAFGCRSDTVLGNIIARYKPVADFIPSADSICSSGPVSFTNQSIGGVSNNWNFGNGSTSTTINPVSSFAGLPITDTSYTVRLIVTSPYSCRDTAFRTIKVNPKPDAQFTSILPGCTPLPVSLANTSLRTVSQEWDFGDGTTDTSFAPSRPFVNGNLLTNASFMVTLTAYSQSGCMDTAKRAVLVYPQPVTNFSSNINEGCGPLSITFNNQSASDFLGSIGTTYDWRFGDGQTSTTKNPSKVYLPSAIQDTVFDPVLIVTSIFGCKDTLSSSIRVFPQPSASFTVSDDEDCGPLTVNFTNTSVPNDTGNISIMSFVWDFANGFNSVTQDAATQFVNNSLLDTTFRVKLYASSEHGCRDTATHNILTHPKPVAAFAVDRTEGCGPFNVTFTNNSQISTVSKWYFGDGDSAASTSPVHSYQSYPLIDSLYTAMLVTQSAFGCVSDTVKRVIIGRYIPQAAFVSSDDSTCNPGSISFFNTSTGGMSNSWNFGNGNTSTAFNPVTTFSGPLTNDTTYTIRLVITSPGTCRDTAYGAITVNPLPDAQFASIAPGCTPLPVSFNNTSLRGVRYEWDFGDGTIDSIQSPAKVFVNNIPLTNTSYMVTLKAYSAAGCQDTAKRSLTLYPVPNAIFTTNVLDGCGPLNVSFNNQSASDFAGSIGTIYDWTFSNGLISAVKSPVTTFFSSATVDTVYTPELIVTSIHGCKDTAASDIRVYPKPVAQFTVDHLDGCGPLDVNFTNSSYPNDTGDISIMSFVWNFANGFNSVTQDAVSQFSNTRLTDTTYVVKLYASSEHGCRDTAIQGITVHPKPIAAFTVNKTEGCGPFTVNFTNISQISASGKWFFGDGDTSSVTNPAHIYQSYPLFDSIYSALLVTESAFGCISDTARKIITGRYLPQASFVASDDSVCNPGTISFFNTSLGGTANSWNFGNGSTSISFNPIITFSGPLATDTTYTIRLVVTSPGTCKDTTYGSVTVNPLPDASFVAVTPGCTPLPVAFNNTTLRGVRYEWDFGDGNTDSVDNPDKTFINTIQLSNSSFLVTLKAYSDFGCMDTAKRNVLVYPQPVAVFTTNVPDGCGPLAISFNNQSASDFSGSIGTTYNWTFSNGLTSTLKNTSTVYVAHPIKDTVYAPVLIATSVHGCKDTTEGSIRVYPKPGAAFLSDKMDGCGPLDVSFTNASYPNDTGDIEIMSFVWDFANGFSSVTKNANSQFINTRLTDTTYKVKLYASSEHGCRDTIVHNITVHPKPIASFTVDKQEGCGPFTVNFTNTSQISTGARWFFGDRDSSSVINTSHIYQSYPLIDSLYTALLVTESSFGCISDTARKNIIGRYLPQASFITSSDSTCNPGSISFFNSSVGGTSNRWNFGNGNTSTSINPITTFSGPLAKDTTYNVRLVVTSPAQCRDTVYKVIKVNPSPDASFVNVTPGCTPLTAAFDNTSLRGATFMWDFGDGTFDSDEEPLKIFTNDVALVNRQYPVVLSVYSSSGCLDTARRIVTVFPKPVVDFTANKTPNCDTAEFVTLNSTQGATTYQWKRGSDPMSGLHQPKLYFRTALNNDTTYSLKLIATTANGCKDSVVKPVVVHPTVRAGFVNTGAASCSNVNVIFTNLTINAASYFWLFGDGTGSPLTSPTHLYSNTGNYDVSLIAYDAFGCSDTMTRANSIHVFGVPSANFLFTPPQAALPNSTIQFTSLATLPPGEGPLTHQWNFGDILSTSNTSTNEGPSHTYTDSGNFVVTYVVKTNNNCFDTSVKDLRVNPHPPIPDFTYDPPAGCRDHTVQFTNISQHATDFYWDFGDATTSTDKNPVHTYKFASKYNVYLRATGPGGVRDISKIEIIEVFDLPRANFFASPIRLILPNSTVSLNDISNDAVKWKWRVSMDGTTYFTDTNQNSSYTFQDEGKFTVQLTAINEHGCEDTRTKEQLVEVIKGGKTLIGNAFTPNGDGYNDTFKPFLQGVMNEGYSFRIYDRWGLQVFKTNNINEEWDGKVNGQPGTIDTYIWLMDGFFVGEIEFSEKGNVTLLR